MRQTPKARHCCTKGFNPRICKRCDVTRSTTGRASSVSIHASVKDATVGITPDRKKPGCFNPRICKRCDKEVPAYRCWNARFNPRICKRCDLFYARYGRRDSQVSIHASVKDATDDASSTLPSLSFQSTHL